MPYKVALRKNSMSTGVLTGEVKLVTIDEAWDESQEYLWIDGNWSCDCNRAAFFGEETDWPCGETCFTALYAELPDGRKIKLDNDART